MALPSPGLLGGAREGGEGDRDALRWPLSLLGASQSTPFLLKLLSPKRFPPSSLGFWGTHFPSSTSIRKTLQRASKRRSGAEDFSAAACFMKLMLMLNVVIEDVIYFIASLQSAL